MTQVDGVTILALVSVMLIPVAMFFGIWVGRQQVKDEARKVGVLLLEGRDEIPTTVPSGMIVKQLANGENR